MAVRACRAFIRERRRASPPGRRSAAPSRSHRIQGGFAYGAGGSGSIQTRRAGHDTTVSAAAASAWRESLARCQCTPRGLASGSADSAGTFVIGHRPSPTEVSDGATSFAVCRRAWPSSDRSAPDLVRYAALIRPHGLSGGFAGWACGSASPHAAASDRHDATASSVATGARREALGRRRRTSGWPEFGAAMSTGRGAFSHGRGRTCVFSARIPYSRPPAGPRGVLRPTLPWPVDLRVEP
jgi:hypothetical protein